MKVKIRRQHLIREEESGRVLFLLILFFLKLCLSRLKWNAVQMNHSSIDFDHSSIKMRTSKNL